MRTIRLCYPARQRIYWIQDNLSANWTPDIRQFADANKIELVPTPTYASHLNRIESHSRPIQEFVFNNTDYLDWNSAQRVNGTPWVSGADIGHRHHALTLSGIDPAGPPAPILRAQRIEPVVQRDRGRGRRPV